MTNECISNICKCKGCNCNFTNILLIQSSLVPGSVPNDTKVISDANGFATITIVNKMKIFITLYIHNTLDNITMAHIHIKNSIDPTTKNGPIVLWLEKSMTHPISLSNNYLISHHFSIHDFDGPLKGHNMDTFLKYLQSNLLYFNVHTIKYPNGEIAGDLILINELNK